MPLIIRKPRDVLLFRSGVASTAHALSETVEQLQEKIKRLENQLKAEREQRRLFDAGQYKEQIKRLLHDLIQEKYKTAKRELIDAASPSPLRH
jgi:uncharacterized protein YaaR (DUF327 family)